MLRVRASARQAKAGGGGHKDDTGRGLGKATRKRTCKWIFGGNEAWAKMSERPMNASSPWRGQRRLLWDKKQERHPLLFGSPAHVAALIRMTFFAPTTPTERERAKQRSPAHVAATFQQRPHINTTDLILEMARKEKSERKKGGRKGRGSYKRQRKSCAATWNSRRPPPSGFTFGRRFIAHFFTSPWLAWLATSPQTSGASPLIIHSYFQSQSVSARAG